MPSLVRQQNSFGRKRAKQCGAVRWQGIGVFACVGLLRRGKIIPAQVLAVLQGKGLERTEAFLLTAVLVTFAASKVTALPRQLSGPMLSAKTTYFRYLKKRKAQFRLLRNYR